MYELAIFIALVAALLVAVLWVLMPRKSGKVSVVYRFHRPDCRYCVESQPEWNRFIQSNKRRVRVVDINMNKATNAERKLFQSFGGSTVPMIVKVYPDGRYHVYDGYRKAHLIQEWVYL